MFVKLLCAVVTRLLFILLSLIAVWRVVWVKRNRLYWFLTILYLPLVAEMILTLRRRKGKDYKWFSPAIFLFLISILPSLWILELHHQENKSTDSRCNKLDSTENIKNFISQWRNGSNGSELFKILLILLILGKWLLPAGGGLTRDQLSQLLLIFVGTAADILEFTSETLSDVRDSSSSMVYIILAVWTWSMLQFPLHLSVVGVPSDDVSEAGSSALSRHRTDIWSAIEALFIQDGPFLVTRLTVMLCFNVVHQMLIFFAIKNFLVVILNIYRLCILVCDRDTS